MEPTSHEGFWTSMVNGGEVDGLEDFSFPMTQDTHGNEEVQVVMPPVSSAPSQGKKRAYAKRSKNSDAKEDEVIVAAWLNTSKDPVHGANQPRASFWGRIHAYYEKHKKVSTFRSESSIMHRWNTILTQVNKFCACYESIERRHKSGNTIKDTLSEACEMYKELDEEKKKFTLIPCWNLLKNQDKWKRKREELKEIEKQEKNKKQKKKGYSTPTSAGAINIEDDSEFAAPETEERKRPIGKKKAKEALRRGTSDAAVEALDKMWTKKEAFDLEKEKKKEERFLAIIELEKKRAEIEEKKAEADLIEKEDKIMSMDITSLSPLQQQYYLTMQRKIVERRAAN